MVVTRAEFESQGVLKFSATQMIDEALDAAMTEAALVDASIDKVFLTGGTSFVPAVRDIFKRRFGAEKIDTGDELLSIANGLALIGERDDAAAWAA